MEPRIACCAFAAFLLMHPLAPFAWLRERLFGPRVECFDGAAAWSPGQQTVALRAPQPITWRRGLLLAAAVEVAVLAAGYQALAPALPDSSDAGMTWAEALWCPSRTTRYDLARSGSRPAVSAVGRHIDTSMQFRHNSFILLA